uniref:Cell division control protein 45 homolog n=1 Tax=Clastoptera arizonana TaxID=38151 RepID=A0A1B6DFH6_9HEMI
MYINDLVVDFYSHIIGKRLLLLANCDIDSVCTCKILQWLFHCDNILYTLIPIQGIEDMITAFEEHSGEVKYVVLINCGGTIDVIETLRPEEDVVFFILDNHRPTDVCNIYNTQQIRLIAKIEEDEMIPEFDEIFNDDDEDDNDGNESDNSGIDENEEDAEGSENEAGESRVAKRRRLNEEAILKRRERRLWEEKRNRLMFEYTQFTYFGRSSAILIYELAWKLSKDNIDVLWWAIVGITQQFVLGHVPVQKYQDELDSLQLHIGRLCPNIVDNDDTASQHSGSSLSNNPSFNTSLKIISEKDLNLVLYRHWTVEKSLRHSMFLAVRLKLWTIKGEKRLHQLLAEMGLPLAESRQMFSSMDLNLRKEFHGMMEKMAKTHDLDIMFTSFTLHHGFRNRYQATDYVYAMLALFCSAMKDKNHIDCFLDALGCLSRQNKTLLDEGIVKAKMLLTIMYRQVQNSLDMKQVISAGPFLYLVIQEGTLDSRYYSQPICLHMLAQILLRAYVATARRKSAGLPLIISAPFYSIEGTCLVLGVPPLSETIPRNFFGKAFEQAAEKTNSNIEMDYFNTAVIRMKTEDRAKFFDALTALLS